jgi:hypothetical protein
MTQTVDRPSNRAGAVEATRLKQLYADVFGANVLSTLALRIEAVSGRSRQQRTAIAWARVAQSCDARAL